MTCKLFRRLSVFLALAAGVAGATLLAGPASAEGKHEAPIRAMVEKSMRAWAHDPIVIAAIKEQNERHAKLTQADIDTLDKQWRAEVKAADKPLIAKTMGNTLSTYLKKVEADSKGVYTEIFVMDNKGLNVGQSDVTSDYWQGDEDKWQKTFLVGADAVFVDKVEKDESSQQLQSQVSFSIVDPASKQVIGAVTVGVNVEALD